MERRLAAGFRGGFLEKAECNSALRSCALPSNFFVLRPLKGIP